jgi:tetratricopeptide (TPR) repeat protein
MRLMTRRLPLLMTVALSTALTGSSQQDEWRVLINQGTAAETSGEYARAAVLYRNAGRIAETFERGDPRRAFTFNVLGMMDDALGQFADAELAYLRALASLEESSLPFSLDRATVRVNLAIVYIETGQTAHAEKLLDEAMAIHAAAGEPDAVRRANVQNSLAELLTVTGRHEEADRLLTGCLAVLEGHQDARTEFGIAQNFLGVVRSYQGRFAEAARLHEQSLALLRADPSPRYL